MKIGENKSVVIYNALVTVYDVTDGFNGVAFISNQAAAFFDFISYNGLLVEAVGDHCGDTSYQVSERV